MQSWLSNFAAFRSRIGTDRSSAAGSSCPPRRRFVRYEIDVADGRLWLVDRFEECDRKTDEYHPGEFRTILDLNGSGWSAERLLADSGHRLRLASQLSELRHEVDRSGLKIFFDCRRDGTLQPKWRYRLRGRWVTDLIRVGSENVADPYEGDPDLMPTDLPVLAASDQRYYQTDVWRAWFGRKMQRKRETVVLGAVLEPLAGSA